ncbi:MAG TPA: DUF1127 domain-containing protein [Ideonella sp.]|nr:DUF1127 domain-containing protein [Ideonella sp.]
MIAKTLSLRRPLQIFKLLELAADWLKACTDALKTRRRYARDRRLLADMNDHALADIGIGRDQIGPLTSSPAASRFGS